MSNQLLRNKTKRNVLFERVEEANTYVKRLKGLLGKSYITENYALIIHPCKGIHTMFMRFPISLIVLDRHKRVISIYKKIEPFKMIKGTEEWHYVIECHSIKPKQVEIADQLEW